MARAFERTTGRLRRRAAALGRRGAEPVGPLQMDHIPLLEDLPTQRTVSRDEMSDRLPRRRAAAHGMLTQARTNAHARKQPRARARTSFRTSKMARAEPSMHAILAIQNISATYSAFRPSIENTCGERTCASTGTPVAATNPERTIPHIASSSKTTRSTVCTCSKKADSSETAGAQTECRLRRSPRPTSHQ